jgi:hypothetical protein
MFDNFFRKSCHLWNNVEKCGGAWEATDDNTRRRIRFACWMTKARIHIHTYNVSYICFFHGNNRYAKAPQCYIIVPCLSCWFFFVHGVTAQIGRLSVEVPS